MSRQEIANKCAEHALRKIEQNLHFINTLSNLEGIKLNERFERDLKRIMGTVNAEEKEKQRAAGLAMMEDEGAEESEGRQDDETIRACER